MSLFYFQLSPPLDGNGRYKPQLVALSEGLESRGVHFGANIDYYARDPPNGRALFHKVPFRVPKIRCYIVGLDFLLDSGTDRAKVMHRINLCRARGKPAVVFDWVCSRFFSGGRQWLSRVDAYFYYSYNRNSWECRDARVRPWPIGFTRRVMTQCARYARPFQERRPEVFWSHRIKHAVRGRVWLKFYKQYDVPVTQFHDGFEPETPTPYDVLMARQTGNRHNPAFYQALGESQLVDCCGGFFQVARDKRTQLVRQFDSYKLWEAFVAGCCVITLDMEYYGLRLPAMPQAGVHYIGLRLDQPEVLRHTAEAIRNGEVDVEAIAAQGHEWALQHYSPDACAQRFLSDKTITPP